MNATCAKTAFVPLVLAATWATAKADDFLVSVTPNSGVTLNDVHVYSAMTTTTGVDTSNFPTSVNPGTTTQGEQALSSNLGSVTGSNVLSTTISTSYGTSALDVPSNGTEATFGLLATSNGFAVLSANSGTSTYAGAFGSTGVTQAQALSGIQGGSFSTASSLFPNQTPNSLTSASDAALVTGSLFAFDANGKATSIGTWSVAPKAVPEPATMAALGVGALGLMRRRRKLSSCLR